MNESVLYIHLGQDEHYISLNEMNEIIKTVKIISGSIANNLFSNPPKELFVVYPYENGSFKIKMSVKQILLGSVALIIGLSNTDSGQAFVKGLTGNETPYYYEKLGEFLRDCVKGILEKNIDELETINNLNKKYFLDKSIKAKSDLYNTLDKSSTIKSINFNKNNEYIIKKQFFYKHIKNGDIVRQLEPQYKIKDFIISKSINTKDKGKWTFKSLTDNQKILSAEILDNDFLIKFWDGQYPLKEQNRDDIIKALLRINTTMKNGNKEKEEYFIEEIFSFNENKIKNIPQKYSYNNEILF